MSDTNKIDYTLYAPDAIAQLGSGFEKNERVKFEKGYVATLDKNRFFINARATLPLKDIDDGVGFGLWVEVSKKDFDKYLATESNDEMYRQFVTEGKLAHDWPGFIGTEGLKVKVRSIRLDEKIYVTEVIDQPDDVSLVVALRMQANDVEMKQLVENQVRAYFADMGVKLP